MVFLVFENSWDLIEIRDLAKIGLEVSKGYIDMCFYPTLL